MTVKNNPDYPAALAQKQGQDVFEIVLPNWGIVEGTDYQNTVYPDLVAGAMGEAFPLSVAALAIGPRSLVDRAWVTYTIERAPTALSPLNLITDRVRRLSVGAPLGFSQAAKPGKGSLQSTGGPPSAFYTQYSKGLLYVFAGADPQVSETPPYWNVYPSLQETTVLPVGTVKKATNGTTTPFGIVADTAERIVFMPPMLHLVAYLQEPIVIPTKRFPLQASGAIAIEPGESANEICIAQIPIFGRKHVRCDVSFSGVGFDIRGAIIRAVNQNAGLCFEGTSTTGASPASGGTASISFDDPCGDYLMLYVTTDVSVAEQDGFFVVAAED